MLRAHFRWGLVAAAVVFLIVMRSAVRKPEVYQSDGYLQLNVPKPRTDEGLFAAALAMDAGSQTQAELMALRSRAVARSAVEAPGSRIRAYLQPVREGTWSRWWSALREAASAHVHVVATVPTAPTSTRTGRLRLERLADGSWQAVPSSGISSAQPLRFRFREPWTDTNGNGSWDEAEPFTDANGNGTYDPPEPFDDLNGDDVRNPGDPPGDEDAVWPAAAESFVDTDGDGTWFAGEQYEDRDGDGRRSPGEPFDDVDGNGTHDPGEPLVWAGVELVLTQVAGDPNGVAFDLAILSTEDAVQRVVAAIETSEAGAYSDVAVLRASSGDPFQAREIVHAVMDAYVASRYEARLTQSTRLLAWLQGELGTATRRLREAYGRRDDYVRQRDAVLLEERATAAFEEQGALARERLQFEFELETVRDQLALLKAERPPLDLLRLVPADEVDAHTSSLIDERTRLQMELGRLARHGHGVGSLEHDDARARIEQTELLLGEAAAKLVAERSAALRQEEERLARRLAAVVKREELQATLRHDLPRLEQGLVEVNRPVQQYERLVHDLARWRSEAEIARASTAVPVAVLEAASLHPRPIAPNRLLDLALAVVSALGAGLGACWLREHLDHRVRNARQVERGVGKPLAGAVPAFRTVRRRERAKRSKPLVALDQETGLLAETYRKLRASIRHEHRDTPIRTMAITSPTQGEGKSLTTMNLAITMAQAGERVLVIDGDLRRPAVHRLARTAREPGLAEVLAGDLPWRQAVVSGPIAGLDILPAGSARMQNARLLESDAMVELLRAARGLYDAILIDVPPVLAVSDALAFFHHLDGVFLLVRAGRYGTDVPREAAELIERAGGRLRGVILNAFDARLAARRGGAYYGYRYGARYAYR